MMVKISFGVAEYYRNGKRVGQSYFSHREHSLRGPLDRSTPQELGEDLSYVEDYNELVPVDLSIEKTNISQPYFILKRPLNQRELEKMLLLMSKKAGRSIGK